ncbi:MAG: crossover junction endodeoxyribonuclease RuvC [Armatimonadota bacterium]
MILALDMSLVNTGWAAVSTISQPEELYGTGCIVTKPGPNRKGQQSADDIRRSSEIAAAIACLIAEYKPLLIVGELPYGSQGATAAKAEGICKGIMGGLRAWTGVPCLWVRPQASKFAVCGAEDAAKAEVQKVVDGWWPHAFESLKKAHVEHVADALAAVVAARASDLYMMVRQQGRAA